jgi:hypothetical protein
MTDVTKRRVDECGSCPFFAYTGGIDECTLVYPRKGMHPCSPVPAWCPLRERSILLELGPKADEEIPEANR